MAHMHGSVLERLAKALHHHYEDIVREPLPRRWVDLILHLEEQERQAGSSSKSSACAERARKPLEL